MKPSTDHNPVTYIRLEPDVKEAVIREAGRLTQETGQIVSISDVLLLSFKYYLEFQKGDLPK